MAQATAEIFPPTLRRPVREARIVRWQWVAVLALLFASAAHCEETTAAFREGALELELNAQPGGPVLVVLYDDAGQIWLNEQDLRALRLMLPRSEPHIHPAGRYFPLSAIEGATVTIDEPRQRMHVTVPASAFRSTRIDVADRPVSALTRASPGAFLNYDLFGQHVDERSGGGFAELGIFGPAGVLTNTTLARLDGSGGGAQRLDTTFTRDIPDRLLTWSFGDAVSDGGRYGNSLRFGGLRVSRNFSLRPDLLTLPLPGTAGSVSVPSTVDVLVNGQLVSRQTVPPGPFAIERVPTVSGSGQISVVVRDALGREQVATSSFYASTSLLARGLSEYALDVGPVRKDYALNSNHYGALMAQGTWRRGLTDSFTLESHAEYGKGDARNAGMTVAAGVGQLGVLNLTAAAGADEEGMGWLRGAGFERRGRRFSFVASGLWADADYRQLGDSDVASARFRSRILVQSGMSFGGGSSLAFAFARQTQDSLPPQHALTATYGMRIGQSGMLHVTATDFRGTARSTTGFITFTMPLGGGRSFSAAALGDSITGRAEALGSVLKNVGAGTGTGYRLSASSAGNYEARWQRRSDATELTLESRTYDGMHAHSLWLSGGLTLLGGQLNPSRSVDGSFAVVDSGGIGGVPIYLENQHVATTDESGHALIANLRPYESNRVGVQPQDLPLDTSLGAREVSVAPPYRSGVVVRMPLQRVRHGVFRLMRSSGRPVPPGAWVDFNGKRFPVVLDGFVYVTNFDHGLSATAKWQGGWCRFRIQPPPAHDPMPDMGTISCHDLAPSPFQRRTELDVEHEAR